MEGLLTYISIDDVAEDLLQQRDFSKDCLKGILGNLCEGIIIGGQDSEGSLCKKKVLLTNIQLRGLQSQCINLGSQRS